MYMRNTLLNIHRAVNRAIYGNSINIKWLLLFVLFSSEVAFSRSDDIKQPVNIDAGSVTFNRAKGYAIYEGNVSIKQGTLKLSASKIEIFAPNNAIVRIEASGSPVRFQQTMDDGKKATGQANIVRYLVKDKKLLFSGNAKLTQHKDTVTSPSISYAVNTGELKAGSKKSSGKGQGDKQSGRVKAIFYPTN